MEAEFTQKEIDKVAQTIQSIDSLSQKQKEELINIFFASKEPKETSEKKSLTPTERVRKSRQGK